MNSMPDLGREDGFSMYIVIGVMMVLLTIGAALSVAGHQSSTAVNNDELGVRALQAAEAGAQAAVHRMNLQQPADNKCIRTTVTDPQSGNNWCAPTSAETVGNNASYRYQTSLPLTNGCTGQAFADTTPGLVERCVVSVGTAHGVSRRVVQRVVSSSGADPFPTNGIVGKDFISMGSNNTINGGLGTNGQLTLGSNSTVSGTVQLWANAPDPVGYSGTVQENPNPFVFSPPNMLNPTNLLNSATSNDNARLLAGANPADTCSPGTGPLAGSTCYRDTSTEPRTLQLGNQGSVTLGGGTYNFCQINLGQGATVNIAIGAQVLIYIDSPTRSGSGCKEPSSGGLGGIGGNGPNDAYGNPTPGNNAIFSNPSGDPRALQIVVYGNPQWPLIQFPNNATMAAAIYAPNTGIELKNNGSIVGGITAQSVTLKNNAVTWDGRLDNHHFATTLVYYRGRWRQCDSQPQVSTAPYTGCL